MYINKRKEFDRTAKFWTEMYATQSGADRDSAVKKLSEMGFDRDKAKKALEDNNWDQNAAAEALLSSI